MKLYAEDPFSSFQNKAVPQITLCQSFFFLLKTCVSLSHTYWSNYLIICLLQQIIISRKQSFCFICLLWYHKPSSVLHIDTSFNINLLNAKNNLQHDSCLVTFSCVSRNFWDNWNNFNPNDHLPVEFPSLFQGNSKRELKKESSRYMIHYQTKQILIHTSNEICQLYTLWQLKRAF